MIMEDRVVDKILNYEIKIKSITFKVVDLLFVFALWVFALMVRLKLYPIESADYFGFLEEWMNKIKSLGALRSLGVKISNYSSSYMYLMCIFSKFDNSLYALKTISVIFDYLGSIAVFLILHHWTGSTRKSIMGMAIFLLCPTVFIDSAYWCQCDVIYCTFILYAFYFLIRNNSKMCFIMLGFAFSFKLQTLFILPFIIIMFLKKYSVKLYQVFYIPLVFAVMQIPAWMLGRPLKELLLVYSDQSGYYPWGTLEYPNIYALLDETIDSYHHMNEVSSAGFWASIIIIGFVAYYMYSKSFTLTPDIIVTTAMFTVAIIVYTLPHMHDRYGFLVDLFGIIYGVMRPKKMWVSCGFFVVSIISFIPYLTAARIIPITSAALMLTAFIIILGHDLYTQINEAKITVQESIQEEA